MTAGKIKENAETHASLYFNNRGDVRQQVVDAYIAGAHSRDEEIEILEHQLNNTSINLKIARKELDKLRNPWIKVDDEHLPKCENKIPDSLIPPHRIRSSRNVIVKYGEVIQRGYYSYARECWEWNEKEINVDYWMPIPEVK